MELDWILCDEYRNEIGFLQDAEIDLELGGGYGDCQLKIKKGMVKSGYWLYVPNTEYIACLEDLSVDTSVDLETWEGNSVRKFLEQAIIRPLPGDDYRLGTGDANEILAELIEPLFGGAFKVQDQKSGVRFVDFQFPRYCTVYDGIVKMLESVSMKLKITAFQTAAGFDIMIEAVPALYFVSGYDAEFSEDEADTMRIEFDNRGINHLVCLGKGELKDRQVVDLYLQSDGSVSQTQYFTGFQERTEVYEYSGVETLEDLIDNGIKKLLELAPSTSFELIPNENQELDIGDFIVARSYEYDYWAQVKIKKKIVKLDDGITSIEYETEKKR